MRNDNRTEEEYYETEILHRIVQGSLLVNVGIPAERFSVSEFPVGSIVSNQITGARYTVENEGPLVESEARIEQRLEELIEEAKRDGSGGN